MLPQPVKPILVELIKKYINNSPLYPATGADLDPTLFCLSYVY